MEQVVDGRGDDVDTGAQVLLDALDRLLRTEVARGAVGDGVGHGRQHRFGIAGREDARRADLGARAGFDADLVRIADDHRRQSELTRREHRPDRRFADVPRSPDDNA